MEPYIIAGMVIGGLLLITIAIVKHIYDTRTHTPKIDVEGFISSLIPKPPEMK